MKPAAPGLGERLRTLRVDAGLTQRALGDLLFVSNSTVSNWEAGRKSPRWPELVVLADSFGVTLDWLVAGRTWGHREGRVLVG